MRIGWGASTHHLTNGGSIVMHKIAFVLAAAAIAAAGPTLSASAIQGAGGVGHGKGDAGHSRFERSAWGVPPGHAGRGRFERRAWGVPPWYGSSCYSRVRTPLGWRKRWVCY